MARVPAAKFEPFLTKLDELGIPERREQSGRAEQCQRFQYVHGVELHGKVKVFAPEGL